MKPKPRKLSGPPGVACTELLGGFCVLLFLLSFGNVLFQALYISLKFINRLELLVYDLKIAKLSCEKFSLRLKLGYLIIKGRFFGWFHFYHNFICVKNAANPPNESSSPTREDKL